MSAKQYEQFLAECFIEWVSHSIDEGVRYQFKSPDKDNSLRLYQAFCLLAQSCLTVEADQVELPYVDINGISLIPVLHGVGPDGYTENYISRLRDAVAGRSGEFQHSALLIIHNSNLDTLINSAYDTSAVSAIWHPKTLASKLSALIDNNNQNAELSSCLLQDQLAMIIEDGATVFGFSPLYKSLDDGELAFGELGLFQDPLILNMTGQLAHIRNRLDENRKLRNLIEFSVEHYPGQLETVLKEFSPKFINEHFEEKKDWQFLDFESYLKEKEANRSQKLMLEDIGTNYGSFYQRAKSQTKVGQKELSLLIPAHSSNASVELNITFTGGDIKNEQFKFLHNNYIKDNSSIHINRAGGKRSRVTIKLPFHGEPTFFSLELKRDNRSEEYKFRCLIVEDDDFYIDAFKNNFRIEPNHQWITLQLEEDTLIIDPENELVCELSDSGELVDCSDYSIINFSDLSNQSEEIQFTVVSSGHELKFNIEGAASEETLSIPLLYDKDRFQKLFKDDYNAEFNRAKNKVVIDNNESSVIGVRLQLLTQEAEMVDQRVIAVTKDASLKLTELNTISEGLKNAYSALFEYYEQHKTLPSLVSWGSSYRNLVQVVIDEYETALGQIPKNEVMTNHHRKLLIVGSYLSEDKERLSPLHPLIFAYHLQLVNIILQERTSREESTFPELADVTRERLVASGLLPYVYHPESGYAHIVPTKENRFWLEVVPQKQISYSYVKNLVKDKLAEFTHAYKRLFAASERSSIIINAINQGYAEEFFLGIVEYFKANSDNANASSVHINFYDDKLQYNDFDRFAETASYESLKEWLKLNRDDADLLIDLVRSRLTYSKFTTPKLDESFAYAHLAFFRNNAPVDCRPVNLSEALSGVVCNGLIAGEAAETKGDAYFTAFGLRNIDITDSQSLRLAYKLGCLWQPAKQSNTPYLETGLGLAVSANFKDLLVRSYDSALWTTIIDPKVTLDFFANQKDVVLIHYSDQYTSAAGYDAITVTKQVDLFIRVLQLENKTGAGHLLSEFNAFNGEWLLSMLTAHPKERKEKNGIIGAYKFIRAVLRESDICWVPLSVAEMIRVSGNVGLKMSDSEFSRNVNGYKKGAISDDVLFVGFKDDQLYLLPLEVKTGVRPDYSYAGKQAKELKRYLQNEVIGPRSFASHLYRGLFIRQVLMQVEKFRLYGVLSEDDLAPLLGKREWWLKGEYQVVSVPEYVDGFVVAHVENDSCFEPSYQQTNENILQVELPYSLLRSLINANNNSELEDLVQICKVPAQYRLQPFVAQIQLEATSDIGSGKYEHSLEQNCTESIEETRSKELITQDLISKSSADLPLNILFGHDILHQKPLHWEPTNTARFMNTNTGIIGTMGTGKTQFTKSLVTQLMKNQHKNVNAASIGLLIFDYKSDYVDDAFTKANNAKRYQLHRLPYNPLSLFGDMPMLPVHTATGFSETMAKAFGLGQKQQLKLRKLILDAYELAGIHRNDSSTWSKPAPTIAQVWDLFLDQEKIEEDSLYAALDNLATYEIFETDPEVVQPLYELLDGVTVIELAGYSPQIQNLVVALTLDLFYAQMQKRGKPVVVGDYRQITKMILVDEADNFMSQDFASLKKIMKEGREYGVGIILSTQQMTHFKTTENNYASYILTWIVHRVSEIKNSDIQLVFNQLDKNEQDTLKITIGKLDKHFSLYIDGDKKVTKMRDMAFWELGWV